MRPHGCEAFGVSVVNKNNKKTAVFLDIVLVCCCASANPLSHVHSSLDWMLQLIKSDPTEQL